MKNKFPLLIACLAVVGFSTPAQAESGFVSAGVNLRSGPGVNYPIVATVNSGQFLEINGCVTEWNWCEVSWRGFSGWISSHYLRHQTYGSIAESSNIMINLPTIIFNQDDYWDKHYRDRPFYNEWNTKRNAPEPRPARNNNYPGQDRGRHDHR